MRAAQVTEQGRTPEVGSVARPEPGADEFLLKVTAAALNPVTLTTASGEYYGGHPPLPYIPGTEGTGRVLAGGRLPVGTRVRFEASEIRGGALAEFCVASQSACTELPENLSDALAAGLGVAGLAAWLALRDAARLRPGETVLVLGATGAVGQIGIQAARIMQAGRIVAAGRDQEALQKCLALGADAVVTLHENQDLDQMAAALTGAAEGPLQVVLDPVFGRPSMAASRACGLGARLVNLGQSASPEATYRSRDVRGHMLRIVGHANGAVSPEVRRSAFQELAVHAAEGRIRIEVEEFSLEEVERAWRRQQDSPHSKVVVRPA
jgi:NADPH:quinone reductase-like Zn-dependent oxidoreductase